MCAATRAWLRPPGMDYDGGEPPGRTPDDSPDLDLAPTQGPDHRCDCPDDCAEGRKPPWPSRSGLSAAVADHPHPSKPPPSAGRTCPDLPVRPAEGGGWTLPGKPKPPVRCSRSRGRLVDHGSSVQDHFRGHILGTNCAHRPRLATMAAHCSRRSEGISRGPIRGPM